MQQNDIPQTTEAPKSSKIHPNPKSDSLDLLLSSGTLLGIFTSSLPKCRKKGTPGSLSSGWECEPLRLNPRHGRGTARRDAGGDATYVATSHGNRFGGLSRTDDAWCRLKKTLKRLRFSEKNSSKWKSTWKWSCLEWKWSSKGSCMVTPSTSGLEVA